MALPTADSEDSLKIAALVAKVLIARAGGRVQISPDEYDRARGHTIAVKASKDSQDLEFLVVNPTGKLQS